MMALAAAVSPIVDAQRQLKVDTLEPNASPGQVAADGEDGKSDGQGTQSAASAKSRESCADKKAAQPASDGSSQRRRLSCKQSEI